MSDARDDAPASGEMATGTGSESVQGVSIEKLADRVYQLMLREARLERERGASIARRGR